MRRIGKLTDAAQAKRFCDYLVTLSIDASSEQNSSGDGPVWDIWIREETDVSQARDELAAFQQSPKDAKYQVADEASKIRDDKVAENQRRLKHRRNAKQVMSRTAASGPLSGASVRQQNIPVTIGIIIVSIFASFSTNFARPRASGPGSNEVSLEAKLYYALSFTDRREYEKSGDPFEAIKRGEVWRLITPMFLHGHTFHLAFNMLWMFFLGSAIERLHGSLFMGVLVVVTGLAGTMLQVMLPDASSLPAALVGLSGTPFSIGASGAVYGLFGFLWIRPMLDPSYPIRMVPTNVALMLGWLVFCMTPMMTGIANGAHLGGLIAGMLATFVAVRNR